LRIAFGLFQPVAGNIQLDDDAVMYELVDSRRRGHRVFEDALPFRKGQIAG